MSVPLTFSVPDAGDEPSVDDCLRDGVCLMLRADATNARRYSFDDDDPSVGVRIFAGRGYLDITTGRLKLPQMMINVAVPSSRLDLQTSNSAERTIRIHIWLLERPDTSFVDIDVENPTITPEAKMATVIEILQRGTLYMESQAENETSQRGVIIDPYYSPLLEDGTYDPDQVVRLNTAPPEISWGTMQAFPEGLAVGYGLFATYTVDMTNRKNMRRGGLNAAEG